MMINKPTDADRILNLAVDCRAPKKKVFETWTQPEWLKKWFFADVGYRVTEAEVDLRVGGRYVLAMCAPGSTEPTRMVGEYLVVHDPDSLVYTWSVVGRPATEPPTLVTAVFTDRDKGSRLDLTHGVFVSVEDKKQHEQGWRACFRQLERLLEG